MFRRDLTQCHDGVELLEGLEYETVIAGVYCFNRSLTPFFVSAQSCVELCDAHWWNDASSDDVHAMIATSDVNAFDVEYGAYTPLETVVRYGDTAQMLLDAGAEVNTTCCITDITALMTAAEVGNTKSLVALLDAGADVNARAEYDQTALMVAAEWSLVETGEILLEAGAEVDAQDEYGETALVIAAKHSSPEGVIILVDAGADLNARDRYGVTPLMHATEYDRPEIVMTLLQLGVDAKVRDENGMTALDHANKDQVLQGTDAHLRLKDASLP